MKNTLRGLILLTIVFGLGFIFYDLTKEYLEILGWNILFIFPILGMSYLLGRSKKVKEFLNVI